MKYILLLDILIIIYMSTSIFVFLSLRRVEEMTINNIKNNFPEGNMTTIEFSEQGNQSQSCDHLCIGLISPKETLEVLLTGKHNCHSLVYYHHWTNCLLQDIDVRSERKRWPYWWHKVNADHGSTNISSSCKNSLVRSSEWQKAERKKK